MKRSKTSNPVEQLNLLRSFVNDDTPASTTAATKYTETDLLECLKLSGYNVQRAAELLITGQFRKATATGMVTNGEATASQNRPRHSKSAFFRATAHTRKPSPTRKKNTKKETPTSYHKPVSVTVTKTNTVSQPPETPRVSMTPLTTTRPKTTSTPSSTTSPHRSYNISRKSFSNSSAVSVPTSTAITATPPRTIVTDHRPAPLSSPPPPPPPQQQQRYLLCRRWVSDAIVTCRTASIQYREVLQLDYTQSGYSMVGFRSASNPNIHGRLPENIALLLSPLLRYNNTCPLKQQQQPSQPPTSLIEVQIESMMDDPTLIMGSSLPVQITIYITSPQQFFDITMMTPAAADQTTSNKTMAAQYFADKNRDNLKKTNKKKSPHLTIHEAAFLLLQWAQYGDVPELEKVVVTAAPKIKQVGKAKQRAKNNEVVEIKDDSECANSDSDGKSDTDDDDNDDDGDSELQELNEEDFEVESTEVQANSVEIVTDTWTSMLPDDYEDPNGLAEQVTLRPYQKQALYFMMQRETTGVSREQLDDQLQLLQELVTEQQVSASKRVLQWNHQQHSHGMDIVCDCGPVLVSEKGKKVSRTLGGTIDPISHPLWQRRYLALPCFTQSVTFFVNELSGIATYVPPEPPKHCSGGILADAMGLGKTVMLLALILKSKESRAKDMTKKSPTATLVIAKLSLLPQWEGELKSKTNLTYKIYYGSYSGKPIDVSEFLKDVVCIIASAFVVDQVKTMF
jgi:SNF2-related domain